MNYALLHNRALAFLPISPLHHLSSSHFTRQTRPRTSFPRAKLKVELLTIGKRSGKDAVYDAPVQEFAKRMSRTVSIAERVVKPDAAFEAISDLKNRSAVMLLDEKGVLPRDSVHFAEMVFDALERGGSRLAFVIGDAEGLPSDVVALKGHRVQTLSLSPLTFTHKMVRYGHLEA